MKDALAGLRPSPSVLLVEDEIVCRQALAEILSRMGFEVRKARSAVEGVRQAVVVLSPMDLLLYKQLQNHPELIKTLDWRAFEKLLADILESFGYKVDLMRGTKDGGIDIIAIGKPEPWGEHRYLLQAKRWANRVVVEPVRELKFLHDHMRATRSCLATTSTFTKGAWCLAREYPWQLELRDYMGIRE